MKQTFYLYEVVKSANGMGKIKMFSQEVISLRNDQFHNLLGTITLDVQPIQKEVEKVIEKPAIMRGGSSGLIHVMETLPTDAYDIKVSFKVKE